VINSGGVIESGVARPPMAWRAVGAVAGLIAAVLVATSGGYGYHRDELYFRLLGQEPAWGYVDQPPATPLLARLMTELFGDHLWALRLPGAVAVAGAAVLTALLARDLGGGRGAQVLAAAGVGTAFPLVFGHLLLTATVDLVAGAAIMLCVFRALLRDPRWWLAVGGLTGLALYNKHLLVLPLIAVGAGLLLVGPRRVLWSRWLLGGVALALVVGAPNLLYQFANDWPQLKMAEAIEQDKGAESRATFAPLQLVLLGMFLVPVWVAGLVRLVRDPALRPARAVAAAYPVLCALVLVTGGQPYYTVAVVLALYAAGCPPTVRWFAGRPGRTAVFGAALAVNAAVSAVIALPLLPVSALAATPIADINQGTSDQIGWPVYVRQVADAYAGLPAGERERAAILTANYGEAGALDRYGDVYDLPAVHSGHNELWYRGRPADDVDVIVAVGFGAGGPTARAFAGCEVVRDLDNGVDIPNEEQENDIRVCRGRTAPWSALWPSFQHYS
jgi:4-amino-4-deoxy-L-arabinose transferase-like glycosyltransferase